MTNAKKRSGIISNIVAIIVCLAMLMGTTFAWFTDMETSTGNVIKSGTLNVEAYWAMGTEEPDATATWNKFKDGKIFDNANIEPNHTVARHVKIENNGSLALKFKLVIVPNGAVSALAKVIDVYYVNPAKAIATRADVDSARKVGTLADLIADPDGAAYGAILSGESETATIALKMQETAGNEYQNLSIGNNFDIKIIATQYSYEKDDFGADYDERAPFPWSGAVDTSWYNDTDTEFSLNTAEQLAGLAQLVDAGNDFAGKTIKLGANIDLGAKDANGETICFEPIGSYRKDKVFAGTFDGQGYTISNMGQNTWALNNGYYYGDLGLGLFGKVENATIKNVVMDNASISGKSGLCGAIAATAYGNCVFENITVSNTKCNDYQYYAGGVVGWASGKHEYKNVVIDESTIIGGQWGDFDNCNGGIIGGCSSSAEIKLVDCTVACRIDAVNDVVSAYQWYCYRNSGMLIGNTGHTASSNAVTDVAAPNVTCENVTVIYGDWANYTYCEFAGTEYPYVRVQAGVSNPAYYNVRYGHPTDANGNTVVDDNHVHNEGEGHQVPIKFDQLFGGKAGPRYCQYGIATHEGVNVIYNNK